MSKPFKMDVDLDLGPLLKKFRRLDHEMQKQILKDAIDEGAMVVETHGKLNAMDVLNKRPTGTLANSITHENTEEKPAVWKSEIGPTVVYGAIHEFGGIIKPRTAKVLHWVDENGDHHFAKAVHIPARPYMRPALENNIDQVLRSIQGRIEIDLNRFGE